MLQVTPSFKAAIQEPIKRVDGYIVLQDGTQVGSDGDLKSYTVNSTGDFLKTSMSQIKATLIGEYDNIKGTMIDVYYGVFVDSQWEYVLKGKFNITEASYKKDSDTTEFEGYDNMLHFIVPYSPVGLYPTTLLGYLSALCAGAGVVLENTAIFNGTLIVGEDYYKNISEYTFRDVLEDICEASASYAVIGANGNLQLRQVNQTGEIITYENLLSFNTGDKYGGINTLVLSRQPQNDDLYMRDEVDVNRPMTRNILDLNRFKVTYAAEEQ
jgi:hypothetical protein